MEKKVFSILLLTMLLIGTLPLAFNILPVKAEPRTWTVDDDGPADFHTIQEAINSPDVKDGDTIFVKAGTYFEKIMVNKSVSLTGENKDTTIIDGRGPLGPGVNVTSDKVTISGFTIQYCGDWYTDSGLLLYRCNDTLVAGNIIKNNVYSGIGLATSSDNNITNNIITDNPYFGVYLAESDNNNISDNVVSKNVHGMYFTGSGSNFLRDNHMQDNYYNFGVVGISLVDFIQDIDDSNTVEGKPICYFVNRHDEQIPPDSGYVAIVNSTNMMVRDLELTKNDNGLLFANTNSSIIENVTVTGNYGGIELWKSSGNTISNSVASNNQAGIRMETSHSTSVSRNLISNNNQMGIGIVSGSASNIISENTISNNLGFGIFIIESEGNSIYHNNLFNNYPYVSTGYVNTWDDGYPSGGNYWSEHVDVDERSGPNQNEPGNDGIWDHPYVVDLDNEDRYPLVNPWVPRTVGVQVGDWVKYSVEIVGYRPGFPVDLNDVEWGKTVVQAISGTTIEVELLWHLKNGTEITTTGTVDVVTSGYPGPTSMTGLFVSKDLPAGATLYATYPFGAIPPSLKINETVFKEYLGVSRETNRAEATKYGVHIDAYWDKATGILSEFNEDYEGYFTWSLRFKVVDTNLWKTLSPTEATQELIETIRFWNMPKGTENSLTAKLKAALHLLDIGNENVAVHKLTGFINQVEALRGKKLTIEQANYLTSEAQRIINLINQ